MKTKKTKTMARSVCAGALLLCCVVPAYATASDPLSIVNNLSDFIFSSASSFLAGASCRWV